MLRSALTVIGVIIGVAGVIGLGAANDGAAKRLEEQIAVHGAHTLSVGALPQQLGAVVRLTDKDASAIAEQTSQIDGMSREIWEMSRSSPETRTTPLNIGPSTQLTPMYST